MIYLAVCQAKSKYFHADNCRERRSNGQHNSKTIAVVSIVQTVLNLNLNRTGYILLKTGITLRTVGFLVII